MRSEPENRLPPLGFIGVGAMGGAMARNLLSAGYPLIAFDISAERLDAIVAAGAERGETAPDVVRRSTVVLTSLRSSAIFVEVAEQHLVPNARPGQVFIDLGTTAPPETRRLAAAFAAKGATLLDVPVSGGPHGIETHTLRMFAGGDEGAFARCRPIIEAIGGPNHVVHCGPSGSGQIVKGVNQLAMGLGDAAYMEALAFGIRAGVDPKAIRQAVGGDDGFRRHFAAIADRVIEGKGEGLWVKFPELPYFLAEAREKGFPLPLTEALHAFLSAVEPRWRDNMLRPTVSFWHEVLTRRPRGELY
jgi:3-hydroxyisobutyrate dehydrogenase-like beta-hydroxyacid dehydrogenase